MKPTDADIIAKFEEVERAHGGPRRADTKGCLRETAALLSLPYERVRNVLTDHWGCRG
jgi:hypothetical protein